ncbi:beta-galactoside alpha-2,6-sialyltransferase 2-like isoform X2 [Stegodyphus dumicola]|nr:beta-galactoside alpha-2,6-sialyltransferase 2-like isoform X2 [Stegodyphus dumicola]XP_035223148.1 beta-galactoside alpha-2,6-sialyltransferase 2-like isoform X2 [Stegodyphus dumicola]XP_035223149.1 beta-galactoside alpha-2,6-sialyltransferase 2-like isoform X2 [Stegodyphus dumicola]
MRVPLIAISIWMFMCMTIFGVISYTYVLWSQYWRTALEKKQLMIMHNANYLQQSALYESRVSNNGVLNSPKGNNTGDVPMDKLNSKIHTYKSQLLIQLRKAQLVAGNVIFHKEKKERNIYKVKFKRQKMKIPAKSQQELICELKSKVKVEMLHKGIEPFRTLGYEKYFPQKPVFQTFQKHNTCAIVSSAGSMYRSKLGKEIDSHDIVLRFNSAPTEGYEDDVGSKTSIRFLNSQVVSKPEFDFFNSALYRNITLIVWDPSKYHGSLDEWYKKPDFDLFSSYWLHREVYPEQPFYILHPEVVWNAWDFIQTNTLVPVEPNPPSSGFLGLLVLLQLCNIVDIYEYVPSMRLTKRCHYFDVHEDIGCTLGDWHPLASEKLLSLALNEGSDKDIFVTGKIKLSGFRKQVC